MKKIAIIGAGISGLYLANLLETNSDFIYKIYEKRSNLDLDDGYGIQLSVNGVRLLNKIGFKNLNAFDLSYPKKVNFFDVKNKKKITDININQFNDETSRYTTLKRSTLIKFLMSNLSDQTINYDTELEKVNYGEQFIIDFSNNSKETFDYIIISDADEIPNPDKIMNFDLKQIQLCPGINDFGSYRIRPNHQRNIQIL